MRGINAQKFLHGFSDFHFCVRIFVLIFSEFLCADFGVDFDVDIFGQGDCRASDKKSPKSSLK